MERRRPILALVLALGLLVGACGSDDDDNADAVTSPGVDTEGAPEIPGSSDRDAVETGEAAGGGEVAPVGPGEAVASIEVDTTNLSDDPVRLRLDVLGLARGSGESLRLELRVTNLSEEFDYHTVTDFGADNQDSSAAGVSLIDLANNRRYLTLVDSDGACVCTDPGSSVTVEPGASLSLQATFPAPPADVTALDVQIPSLGVVPNVAVAGA